MLVSWGIGDSFWDFQFLNEIAIFGISFVSPRRRKDDRRCESNRTHYWNWDEQKWFTGRAWFVHLVKSGAGAWDVKKRLCPCKVFLFFWSNSHWLLKILATMYFGRFSEVLWIFILGDNLFWSTLPKYRWLELFKTNSALWYSAHQALQVQVLHPIFACMHQFKLIE
jgi:hypothetical protein